MTALELLHQMKGRAEEVARDTSKEFNQGMYRLAAQSAEELARILRALALVDETLDE